MDTFRTKILPICTALVAAIALVTSITMARYTVKRDEILELRRELEEVRQALVKCEQDLNRYTRDYLNLLKRLMTKQPPDF